MQIAHLPLNYQDLYKSLKELVDRNEKENLPRNEGIQLALEKAVAMGMDFNFGAVGCDYSWAQALFSVSDFNPVVLEFMLAHGLDPNKKFLIGQKPTPQKLVLLHDFLWDAAENPNKHRETLHKLLSLSPEISFSAHLTDDESDDISETVLETVESHLADFMNDDDWPRVPGHWLLYRKILAYTKGLPYEGVDLPQKAFGKSAIRVKFFGVQKDTEFQYIFTTTGIEVLLDDGNRLVIGNSFPSLPLFNDFIDDSERRGYQCILENKLDGKRSHWDSGALQDVLISRVPLKNPHPGWWSDRLIVRLVFENVIFTLWNVQDEDRTAPFNKRLHCSLESRTIDKIENESFVIHMPG